MKRSVWLPLAILAIVTAVFGVITALNQSGANSVTVNGNWTLISGRDADGDVDVSIAPVTVTIEDNAISGQVCNSWGGNFAVDGARVTVGPIASTEMYCTEPAEIMDLETRILNDISRVTSVSGNGHELRLAGDGIELVFELTE